MRGVRSSRFVCQAARKSDLRGPSIRQRKRKRYGAPPEAGGAPSTVSLALFVLDRLADRVQDEQVLPR